MRWYKGFNPWTAKVKSTLVWVQLPDLPIEFFNREAAMRIGALIGKPIRVDKATEEGARGNYARVCVEVDLSKPLLAKYKVEGIKYRIQYEGLDKICTECGRYGRSTDQCDCKEPIVPETVVETVEVVPETQVEETRPEPAYGDWMMVKKKERRPAYRAYEAGYKGGNYARASAAERNRFQVLNENMADDRDPLTRNEDKFGTSKDKGQEQKEQQRANQRGKIGEGSGEKANRGQQKEKEEARTQVQEKQKAPSAEAKGTKGKAVVGKGQPKENSKKGIQIGAGYNERGGKGGGGQGAGVQKADGAGNLSPLRNK
ncbi:unnamed protein product [Linum trigynum]|uniref:DUF4283 domain-containing protein n=1 Tax=Linum trigynum TaxID=586398 RepID=A0AAV2DL34_9ROSI